MTDITIGYGYSLPFMTEAENRVEGNLSSCESEEKYQAAFRTFWKKAKSNLTLWAECGQSCLIECRKLIYTPYIESVSVAEESEGKFVIYFPEMW
jgi:hypothetical protein